jgi:hypothetical protein
MMMNLFLAQNKHKSKVDKEKTPKLKTYENIKISLAIYCAKLDPAKKNGPWPNSCIP